MPLLSLDGIGFTYDDGTEVLRDISLDIATGVVTTLIGPSGTGKSTMLRLIAGLEQPTTGRLNWHRSLPPGKIGYVFQDATLMPWATVRDNVWLPLRFTGVEKGPAADRVMNALDLVGLADSAARFPAQLSGGMRMRVSIARALVCDPQLLLLDEPFATLDELSRGQLDDEIKDIVAARSMSAVLVTHAVSEAVYLSDEIIILGGKPATVADRIDNRTHKGTKRLDNAENWMHQNNAVLAKLAIYIGL